ncbi:hypothetical protein CL673_02225 [Candidatus Bathyarchaeota archaeon]|jgi:hypothetical protein|nr:hypothetical protein [Candidatus Bathyarchaeota archaeon]MDP6048150.1 hypothetical protein [Candidatus Bathyarchaeota archaeon]MDP7207867.1 hypothetical protein [Candidatus Bathyarchaeota archaeon]MDP7443818.1 hypothetical protein [Candidatus Bathyarchaeota archaeon]|tara:strand:- start:7558 stop:7815 length:258 start_codon:yes stop_codon:yes gene_type:complete
MSYKEIIERIQKEERNVLSEKLTDVILEVKDGAAVPSSLAKGILHKWQENQLSSDEGLRYLLKAALKADKKRTKAILNEMNLGGK